MMEMSKGGDLLRRLSPSSRGRIERLTMACTDLNWEPLYARDSRGVVDVVDEPLPVLIVDAGLAVGAAAHQERVRGVAASARTAECGDGPGVGAENAGGLLHGQGKREIHLPDAARGVLKLCNIKFPFLWKAERLSIGFPYLYEP